MSGKRRLLIDAAAPRSVVGLALGTTLIAERFNDVPRRHAEVLAENIDAVLASGETSFAQIDEIIVGHGPGSFIGIRVALSTALGAGTALGCPVIGVCSVGALATKTVGLPGGTTLCVLDARKGELYVRAVCGPADTAGTEPAPAKGGAAYAPRAVKPAALAAYLSREAIVPTNIVGAVHLVPEQVVGDRLARAGANALGLLWARMHDDQTQSRRPILARYCRAPDAQRPTLAPARQP